MMAVPTNQMLFMLRTTNASVLITTTMVVIMALPPAKQVTAA
jgi:hypothetical protein